MSKIILSICIPTYNREKYLVHTLDSIIGQLNDDPACGVEICISDNASSDNTATLVKEYIKRYPHIVYFRWQHNMGADRNYLKVVEMASGEYCWLFGSDDVMMPGALRRVLAEIETQPDIVLYERAESDRELAREPISIRWTAIQDDYDFDSIRERDRYLHYLSSCHSFGGLFSYLSVIVFRRSCWNQIEGKDRFAGSAYVHVHILLEILKRGAVFHYRTAVVVLCRTGNDSFLSEQSLVGNYRRIQLDIDGYLKISSYVFGFDSEEYHLIRSLVGRSLPISGLAKYKLAFIMMADNDASKKINRILMANGFVWKYFFMRIIEIQPFPILLKMLSQFIAKARAIASK